MDAKGKFLPPPVLEAVGKSFCSKFVLPWRGLQAYTKLQSVWAIS